MATASTRQGIAARLGERTYYGWVMVAVAGFGIFTSGPGQSHTFSVFNKLIAEDLDLSLTAVTNAYMAATVAAAFLLPLFGRQVERFGPRASLMAVTVGLGLACIAFGAVSGFLWLVLAFGALRFLGQGSMMLGSSNLVAQWFAAQRGKAMGLMVVGFAASMAIHPTLGRILIELIGWREAWVAMGVLTWLTMLPLLWFLVINKPEDIGLYPDNEDAPPEGTPKRELTGATLHEAVRHRSFYLVCGGFFMISGLVTALHFHQVNIFEAQGLSANLATASYWITALCMMLLMPIVGRGFDRIKTRYMFAFALTVQASTLIGVTFVTSIPAFVAYALLFGLNNTLSMTMAGFLWPRYFGRRQLGRIQGNGQMILVFGASLGPIPVSWAFDNWGDATGMLQALAVLPLAAAVVIVLFLRTMPQVPGNEHLE